MVCRRVTGFQTDAIGGDPGGCLGELVHSRGSFIAGFGLGIDVPLASLDIGQRVGKVRLVTFFVGFPLAWHPRQRKQQPGQDGQPD